MRQEIITDAITGEVTTRDLGPDDDAPMLAAERAAMRCSRFQAKAALLNAGLLDAADAVMASASPLAQMAWADATEFSRNSPTIAAMAERSGLSETQVDDLFRAAMTITA